MKKLISILLVFVMALSLLTACGADGKDGIDGVNGADGITPQVKIGEDNCWYVSYDEGATWQCLNVQATGEKGDTGEQGDAGEQGDTGSTGLKGPKGSDGDASYIWVKYADLIPTCDEDMKDTVSKYMGIYNGDSATAPTKYTAYQWIEIVPDELIPEVDTDLTVLAIGSSFLNKENAMTYVYNMAESVGFRYIKSIKLGNIYKGGVAMSANYESLQNNAATYTYYENSTGAWVKSHDSNYAINAALAERDWDYIIINQGLIQSGLADTYSCLANYLALIRQYCPNAKVFFSMGWTYPEGSTDTNFVSKYQSNTQLMRSQIVDVMQNTVAPLGITVIPTGTSIENARVSGVAESSLTADSYGHLRLYGRYIASLTVFCMLTGTDPADVPYLPDGITEELQQIAIACVRNAIADPYTITPCAE